MSKRVSHSRLVSQVCRKLGQRAEARGLESLSSAERTALLVWWSKGIIDNGGFEYFYEGTTNAAEVADAYEKLGLISAAEAFRQSLLFFPPDVIEKGYEACREWMARYSEDERTLHFGKLNSTVWNLDLSDSLAEYIRKNSSQLT